MVVLYLLQEFKPTLFQNRSDESALSVNDDYRLGSELVEHLAQQLERRVRQDDGGGLGISNGNISIALRSTLTPELTYLIYKDGQVIRILFQTIEQAVDRVLPHEVLHIRQ